MKNDSKRPCRGVAVVKQHYAFNLLDDGIIVYGEGPQVTSVEALKIVLALAKSLPQPTSEQRAALKQIRVLIKTGLRKKVWICGLVPTRGAEMYNGIRLSLVTSKKDVFEDAAEWLDTAETRRTKILDLVLNETTAFTFEETAVNFDTE